MGEDASKYIAKTRERCFRRAVCLSNQGEQYGGIRFNPDGI